MSRPPARSMLGRILSRLKGTPPRQPVAAGTLRPFQAIAIYRGLQCCEIARRLGEHRFLAKDAPSIPLQGCTMPERCDCRYIKYKDRRGDARRLVDFGLVSRLFDGKERRARKGRRSTD